MSLRTWALAALLAVAAVPSVRAEAVDPAKLSACMLEKATADAVKVAAAEAGKDARPLTAAASVIWFSPHAEQLVCLLSPISAPSGPNAGSLLYVALPWSLVGVHSAGDGCQLRPKPDRELLAAGPCVADPAVAPTADLRRRAYAHFGLATPSWETFTR